MTTAFALALALGLTPLQFGPDPNLKANYHIDRSDQDAFVERLRTKIQKSDGTAWANTPVEISFMAPLGLPIARNELVRNFTEQRISRLEIYLDGAKIPYVEKPKAGQVGFWTLDVDPLTTQDQIAIRIASPGGKVTPTLEIALEGTFINSQLRPGSKPDAYRFELSPKMREVGLEMMEGGVTVDAPRLVQQLRALGLAPTGPYRNLDVLGGLASFYAEQADYDKGKENQTSDVNRFFEQRSLRAGTCQDLNTPSLLAFRSLGIAAFYPSGRILGSSAGHATNYVYDPQLHDAVVANYSGISAGRHSGTAIERFNKGRPRNLIYFELDRTYYHTFGIAGIPGEPEPNPVVRAQSNCGRIAVSQERAMVGNAFPDAVPGASSVRKLDPSDGRFVTFTEDGPKFRTAQGGNR